MAASGGPQGQRLPLAERIAEAIEAVAPEDAARVARSFAHARIGEPTEDGGERGRLVWCQKCSGDGVLFVPDGPGAPHVQPTGL